MENNIKQITQHFKLHQPRYHPLLVRECRDIIREGFRRAEEKTKIPFGADLDKKYPDDEQFIKYLSSLIKYPPVPGFLIMKKLALEEFTPEACAVRFRWYLFSIRTIAKAYTTFEKHGSIKKFEKLKLDGIKFLRDYQMSQFRNAR